MLICWLIAFMAGCSSGQPPDSGAHVPINVSTVMPRRQTFRTKVAAFGLLAADSRKAASLSLPQAGQVVAVKVAAGQHVTRGAPLVELKTNPATRRAYLQAQNAVTAARDNLVRIKHLRSDKLATNSQLDTARKTLADASAALAAEAKLGGAQTMATVKAPADGTVTALDVNLGQRVTAGTPLIAFSPQSALAAQLGVQPGVAASIRLGMLVKIRPVYAARGAPPLKGTVALVGHAVNPKTHMVRVVAALDVPTPLPTGTALSAAIVTAKFTAWAVPRKALESDAQGSYVFQVERGKARRVDVTVVAADGSPVGVTGPIDAHAQVITLGSYEVANGEAVKPAAAAHAPGIATR